MHIKGDNYDAWNVRLGKFSVLDSIQDKISFLLSYAVLAPSTINIQPWKFFLDGNSLKVSPDFSRDLKKIDPNRRYLYISIGAAIQNILIAADYFDLDFDISYHNRDGNTDVVIRFHERSVERKKQTFHLIHYIPLRGMNRKKYLDTPLPDFFIQDIKTYCLELLTVDFISDGKVKNAVADAVLDSFESIMGDVSFRKELALHKRHNYTKQYFGMPGFSMGFSNIFSLFAPFLIRFMNPAKMKRKLDEDILKYHTPCLCIIGAAHNDNVSFIQAGMAYQRMALSACRIGLSTAIDSSIIENNPERLQHILGVDYHPQVLCRIGYADFVDRHTPRFTAERVTF